MKTYLTLQEVNNVFSGIDKQIPEIYTRKFTILIPAYNEKDRISPVLNDVCRFVSEYQLPWEVLVAIDGNDSTYNIAQSFSEKYDFLKIDQCIGRSGKGGAIKRVIPKVKGEFTILMDSDNSIEFIDIIRTITLLNEFDAVVLSRYDRKNRIPFMRRFLSRGFNVIARSMTGLNVMDTQSGYKIFRTQFFVASMRRVTVTNASFDVPLLYYVKEMGGRITETPTKYVHADNGKLNPISMSLSFLISLLAFRIRNSPLYSRVPRFLINLYHRKFKWI